MIEASFVGVIINTILVVRYFYKNNNQDWIGALLYFVSAIAFFLAGGTMATIIAILDLVVMGMILTGLHLNGKFKIE